MLQGSKRADLYRRNDGGTVSPRKIATGVVQIMEAPVQQYEIALILIWKEVFQLCSDRSLGY